MVFSALVPPPPLPCHPCPHPLPLHRFILLSLTANLVAPLSPSFCYFLLPTCNSQLSRKQSPPQPPHPRTRAAGGDGAAASGMAAACPAAGIPGGAAGPGVLPRSSILRTLASWTSRAPLLLSADVGCPRVGAPHCASQLFPVAPAGAQQTPEHCTGLRCLPGKPRPGSDISAVCSPSLPWGEKREGTDPPPAPGQMPQQYAAPAAAPSRTLPTVSLSAEASPVPRDYRVPRS